MDVSTEENSISVATLKAVNLDMYGGEIIGVAGVAGNGQRALAEVMSGHQYPIAGHVLIEQHAIGRASPLEFMQLGSPISQRTAIAKG